MVVFLVMNGADVNQPDGNGKIALHHCAAQGQLQSMEVMLDFKADIEAVSAENLRPLHLAASKGHAWCCKALLVAGTYVDAIGGPRQVCDLFPCALSLRDLKKVAAVVFSQGMHNSAFFRRVRPYTWPLKEVIHFLAR